MKLNLKKLLSLLLVFGLFVSLPTYSSDIPENIEYQGNKLVLNGIGTRIIFFMKVYKGSLYLESKNLDAEKIINNNAPMAIRIDVTSTVIKADVMKKALRDGLEKSTGNNTDSISNGIEQLSSSFNTDVSTGDFYEFIYLPEVGTHVLKNSKLVELIKGIEFKKAFFGIFLSDNPIQKNLKKAMLGG